MEEFSTRVKLPSITLAMGPFPLQEVFGILPVPVFRGEEMLLVDMFGTATSIQRLMRDDAIDPHSKLIVMGRTKGVQQDGKKFGSLCKGNKRYRFATQVWVKPLVDLKKLAGETRGKLFVRN